MIERRRKRFPETLSRFMAVVAALGGAFVLIDPVITLQVADGTVIKIGGTGFSDQLKGAVVALILIEGWKAVKEYWLGASAAGDSQQQSISRIAEAASPVKTESVNVETKTATVVEKGDNQQ